MLFWHLGLTSAIVFIALGRRRIDYRIVMVGAVLPDVVDKPLGRIFFEEQYQSSRLFGHTLLLTIVVLFFVQIALRGQSARRWFVLPISMLIHLALDGMWSLPVILFWPAFGMGFPKFPIESYWMEVLIRPFEHPVEGLKELIGLSVLGYMAWAYKLHQPGSRADFIKTGYLTAERGADLPDREPRD